MYLASGGPWAMCRESVRSVKLRILGAMTAPFRAAEMLGERDSR